MRLFIAEKPSLAKAIADVLPKPHKRGDNCIFCGNDDVVAWCVGHIMEQVPPEEYDQAYKNWALESLPILPVNWKLQVTNKPLYNSIEKLIKKSDVIVNAGDPDREGQLLVDEVIQSVGSQAPIKRILVNDNNPGPVKKALDNLTNNALYKGLSDSALARSRADWLYGMNMSRLYTLLGKKGGYTDVLSVGRVQTPLLGLIVRRDLDIENFKAKIYFTISTVIKSDTGQFEANWKASDKSDNFLDEEKRLINKEHAESIKQLLTDQSGEIAEVEVKNKKLNPPLAYALKDIQMAASKALDLSPNKTLEVVQSLYETHKIVTYPRSDCSHLPEDHLNDIEQVIAAIKSNSDSFINTIKDVDMSLRSPVWNDKKITAHHGIIPTSKTGNSGLSEMEKSVYDLIAFRYLLQFYPVHEFQQTKLTVKVNNEILTTSGKTIIHNGWKVVGTNTDDKEDKNVLPIVKKGEVIQVISANIAEKKTTPPKHFTEASLVEAMSGIARFVQNEKVKQLLKENEGIGTPATQANIIETLFERNYVIKKGKNVLSTQVGKTLIKILPESATIPDMTAFWESSMNKIEDNTIKLESFIKGVENSLGSLINQGKSLKKLTIPGVKIHNCPTCKDGVLNRVKGPENFFWGCVNYPDCKASFPDLKGQPVLKKLPTAKKRPMKKSIKRK
jgi:DNA topoisomerase III